MVTSNSTGGLLHTADGSVGHQSPVRRARPCRGGPASRAGPGRGRCQVGAPGGSEVDRCAARPPSRSRPSSWPPWASARWRPADTPVAGAPRARRRPRRRRPSGRRCWPPCPARHRPDRRRPGRRARRAARRRRRSAVGRRLRGRRGHRRPLLDLRGDASVVPARRQAATAAAVLAGLPPDARLPPGRSPVAGPGRRRARRRGRRHARRSRRRPVQPAGGPAGRPRRPGRRRPRGRAGRPGAGRRHGSTAGRRSVRAGGRRTSPAATSRPSGAVRRRRPRRAGRGRPRSADPALPPARSSPALLGAPAAQVRARHRRARRRRPRRGREPDRPQLVEQMLTPATTTSPRRWPGRLALAEGQPRDFAGGAAAVRAVLTGLVAGRRGRARRRQRAVPRRPGPAGRR